MAEENNQWFSSDGIDQSLITDKVRGFTNADGSMNTNELLKSYNAAQSMIGGSVRIPTDTSTDEERAAFYSKLGRPQTADDYTWKAPDGITVDGADDGNFKAFKEECFRLGMSDAQVSGVMGRWSDIVKDITAKQAQARAEILDASKKTLSAANEWGDGYQAKYDATMKLIEKLGIRDALDSAGVLNSVGVLKAFNSIVDGGNETGLRGSSGGGGDNAARIAALKASPAYLNSSHPEHGAVVRELNSLLDAVR